MNTSCFKEVMISLLLASFLIVQADLPVARAAGEQAPAAGESCAVHHCCCSPEARRAGKCCCAARKASAGYGFHAGCVGHQPQGDMPIVVKFQVVLPLVVGPATQDPRGLVLAAAPAFPAPRDSEPPDPPPKLLVG